jgi:neurofibromin 1
MFHSYFNRFLSLLNLEGPELGRQEHPNSRDESATISDLAINILSNLLSANIDVGLKHSLSIGYHENVEIRTAFVRVLYNILVQGTEFNNLSDTAVTEKYDELLAVSARKLCPHLSATFSLTQHLSSPAPYCRHELSSCNDRRLPGS